jgi:hypothetical protein
MYSTLPFALRAEDYKQNGKVVLEALPVRSSSRRSDPGFLGSSVTARM